MDESNLKTIRQLIADRLKAEHRQITTVLKTLKISSYSIGPKAPNQANAFIYVDSVYETKWGKGSVNNYDAWVFEEVDGYFRIEKLVPGCAWKMIPE